MVRARLRDQSALIAAELRRRAQPYYPDLTGDLQVQLVASTARSAADFFRFRIQDGPSTHEVMVKVLSTRRGVVDRDAPDRPRLAPEADPDVRARQEFTAMIEVERRVAALDDPRFGAVRAVDFLDAHDAIVMEAVNLPRLEELLSARSRLVLRRSGQRIEPIVESLGAWLRMYHGLLPDRGEARLADADEVVALLGRLTTYLTQAVGGEAFFGRVGRVAIDLARTSMSGPLPLGLGHGDFAARNAFVASGGAVSIFDMRGRWRAPIYEDLAYFMVDLETRWRQAAGRPFAIADADRRRYEAALLRGYEPNGEMPSAPLRVFRVLHLLDKWAARVQRRRPGRRHWLVAAARRRLVYRSLHEALRSLLEPEAWR